MWIIIAILLILVVCLYPYVARVIARRRMLTRLCRDIRRVGGKVRRLCRFPALSRNRAKSHELLVRAGEMQYAVKLWSPLHRNAELRISRDGRAQEIRVVGAPLQPRANRRMHTVRGFSFSVPPMKARLRTPPTVRQMPILLISPSYRRMLIQEEGGWREIGIGERLFGATLATPADFLSHLTASLSKSNGEKAKEDEKNSSSE